MSTSRIRGWVATVPRVKGCHTYGRSLSEARSRIREALSLSVNNSKRAELVDDIRLPVALRRLVTAYRLARDRAKRERKQAESAARRVAGRLSRRDARGVAPPLTPARPATRGRTTQSTI